MLWYQVILIIDYELLMEVEVYDADFVHAFFIKVDKKLEQKRIYFLIIFIFYWSVLKL